MTNAYSQAQGDYKIEAIQRTVEAYDGNQFSPPTQHEFGSRLQEKRSLLTYVHCYLDTSRTRL
ncbi:MAG: hypothetical protein RMM98_17385 [Acidobacteriota bacterium]|nr:hypothetical protein [Blastocatellia bacterium]MDW8241377.1 hypothetical protein [Acidobacteriota bacterium]